MGQNTCKKFQKLNFQEIPGDRGINNMGYWKIAGLTACYFQGNSRKLGASIIWLIKLLDFYISKQSILEKD